MKKNKKITALSQYEIARIIGISQPAVSKLMRGVSKPSHTVANNFLKYGVPFEAWQDIRAWLKEQEKKELAKAEKKALKKAKQKAEREASKHEKLTELEAKTKAKWDAHKQEAVANVKTQGTTKAEHEAKTKVDKCHCE